MLILLAGLPGTGKTTLAREFAQRTNGIVLSKDTIRAAIFPPADVEYSTQQDDFVMELMLQSVGFILQRNPARKVFLDGRTFSRCYQIERVIAVANELHQPWRILECICSDESARQRLEQTDPTHPAQNRNFALYQEVKSRFEPITHAKTTIDTDELIEQCLTLALAAIS
jgi:predicted kinase